MNAALPLRIVVPDRRARAAYLRQFLEEDWRDCEGTQLTDLGRYFVLLCIRAMERDS